MNKLLSKIKGYYKPLVTHDLCDEAKPHIGKLFEWQYVYKLDEATCVEHIPYVGQWVLIALDTNIRFFGWVPECDIEVIDENNN